MLDMLEDRPFQCLQFVCLIDWSEVLEEVPIEEDQVAAEQIECC